MTLSAATTWQAAEALGASAKEFAPFQDEPAQMKSGTVGKTGFLRLGFELRGEDWSVRMVYLHMIGEYARHNGHADLLREQLDGVTGR